MHRVYSKKRLLLFKRHSLIYVPYWLVKTEINASKVWEGVFIQTVQSLSYKQYNNSPCAFWSVCHFQVALFLVVKPRLGTEAFRRHCLIYIQLKTIFISKAVHQASFW